MNRYYLALLAILVPGAAPGADPPPPQLKIKSMDAVLTAKARFIEIVFDHPLDGEIAVSGKVTLQSLPSQTEIPITTISRVTGSATLIDISFADAVPASDLQLEITFKPGVRFLDGNKHVTSALAATSTALLLRDAAARSGAIKTLLDAEEKEKPSNEKNIFVSGFVTTASGGQTQGGGDIHLNSQDLGIPGLKSFLNIQKTTSDGSDAKHFEAGGKYRYSFSFGEAVREAYRKIGEAATDAQRANAMSAFVAALAAHQKGMLASVWLDLAGKMEGQATSFNVTNGVFEASLKVQSQVKKLAGSKSGFVHFQLIPGGFEGGKTLRQPDATTPMTPASPTGKALQQLDGIARFKTGASLVSAWKNPKEIGPVRRFDVQVAVVDRYLFLKEIHYDTAAKTNSTIKNGNKPYFQADAKVFVVENETGRYGFKISYHRGSLPPVYAPVKSFHFGFLFESAN